MKTALDINAVASGDLAAFEKLYLAYYCKVLVFITILLHNSVRAEDVAQDVFLKIWRNRASLKADGNIDSYIYMTAKRAVLDILREDQYARKHIEWMMSHMDDEIQDDSSLRDIERTAADVIDSMPPRRKEIFLMSRVEGLSAKEIASRLDLSVHTVNKHITLALSSLKDRLNDYLS